MTYTVIGVYEDTGQLFMDHVKAKSALDAMILSSLAAEVASDSVRLQIVGAVEGEVIVTPPCDESGCAAMTEDLAALA